MPSAYLQTSWERLIFLMISLKIQRTIPIQVELGSLWFEILKHLRPSYVEKYEDVWIRLNRLKTNKNSKLQISIQKSNTSYRFAEGLLLQVRTKTLNNELRDSFKNWYPKMDPNFDASLPLAAWPPSFEWSRIEPDYAVTIPWPTLH